MNEHQGSDRSAPLAAHPSQELLAGYLDHTLAAAEVAAVEGHLDVCRECRLALVDVTEVLGDPPVGRDVSAAPSELMTDPVASQQADTVRHAPSRRRTPRGTAWLAGAAAAASIVVAVTLLQTWGDDAALPGERLRESGPSAVVNEALPRLAVVSPPGGAILSAPLPAFVWRSVDAAQYHFFLLAEDGTALWSQVTTDTSLTLPLNVVVNRGRTYFWYVDAVADGRAASTRMQRFAVIE